MDFTGRYFIPSPPQTVWAGLIDPEVLRLCIPGCQAIEKTSPTDFTATATLKIGPVKATFKGNVVLSELDPPSRCRLHGEGQGGVAGFAKGDAEVILSPEGGGTILTYTAKAAVGGKLAQIGQRLIDGAAKQIADDFFGRFVAALTADAPQPALTPDPLVERSSREAVSNPIPAKQKREMRVAWIAASIGAIAILLLLFAAVLWRAF
jgi:carbon monoxide dehydrogenase subunit G